MPTISRPGRSRSVSGRREHELGVAFRAMGAMTDYMGA